MFKSIYSKMKNDFAFLNKYGFVFMNSLPHNIYPEIVVANSLSKIGIGVNYEEKTMFINWYEDKKQFVGNNLLQDVKLVGKAYKEQVEQVRSFLENFLRNRPDVVETMH